MFETIEQAVDALAELSVARSERAQTWREKRAEMGSDMLSSLGDAKGPLLHALAGAGLGAGAGGLGAWMSNRDKDEDEKRSILGSALTGGLAGGAVGGGVGLARKGLGQLFPAGAPDPPPGQFFDPKSGQHWKLPGDIPPEMAEAARHVQTMDNPARTGIREVARNVARIGTGAVGLGIPGEPTFLERHAPLSTAVLPKIGLLDALHNLPGVNMGERFGDSWGFGRIRPAQSQKPEHLGQGLKAMAEGKDYGAHQPLLRALDEKPQATFKVNDGMITPSGGTGETYKELLGSSQLRTTTGGNKLTRFLRAQFGDRGPRDEVLLPTRSGSGAAQNPVLGTRGLLQEAKAKGHAASYKEIGGKDARVPASYRFGTKQYPKPGLKGAWGMRLGLYAGVPAMEMALRATGADNKEEMFRKWLQTHAKPAE